MKYFTLLISLFSSALFAVENRSTTCQFGEKQRIIEVVYPEMTVTPCEVRYTKNGQTQVLWSANSELGYCENKADAFIEKQRGWGWQCNVESIVDDSTNDINETNELKESTINTEENFSEETINSAQETTENLEDK